MMLKKIKILAIVAVACATQVSCTKVKQEENQEQPVPEPISSQITLVNNSGVEGLGIQMFDVFGNNELIEFTHNDTQQVAASSPVIFSLVFSPADVRFFRLYPGETIYLLDGEEQGLLMETGDSTRNNELLVSSELTFSLQEFGSVTVGKQEANALYARRSTQLAAFQKTHAITADFYHYMQSFVKAYNTNNHIMDAVKGSRLSEIGRWKNVVNEDVLVGAPPYHLVLHNLNRLVADSLSAAGAYGLEEHYRFIQGMGLQKEVEDQLAFTLLKNYKVGEDVDLLVKVVKQYTPSPKHRYLKNYLESNLELTRLSQAVVGKNIVLQTDGRTDKLETVLEKHKNNVIYIDLWASWCAPCLAQMPFSRKLEEEFEGQDIVFLTLSMDKNRYKWEKKSGELELDPENNYLLVSNFDSPLANALQLKDIPRYLLVNRRGQVVDKNAPRPQDPELSEVLQELLK